MSPPQPVNSGRAVQPKFGAHVRPSPSFGFLFGGL
jgi:hypothetical protein